MINFIDVPRGTFNIVSVLYHISMKKMTSKLLLMLLLGFVSCGKSGSNIDVAKQYYSVLNNPNYSEAKRILADSILTTEIAYKKVFLKTDYIEFLKWDAVFKPKYEVSNMEENQGTVKAIVSKIDKRVLFLHESPIIYKQIIQFKEDKIYSVETPEYINFNDTIFSRNRKKLLGWIKKNHPELDGFIHDQTKVGALNYLKAINLYSDAH